MIEDSTLNIRALEILKNSLGCAYATARGEFGAVFELDPLDTGYGNLEFVGPMAVDHDSLQLNFRALAANAETGFAISIGNPAMLYRLDADGSELVYSEDHESVFYDSMDFWNEQEGIAIGDPTEGCMSILITRNAGNSWSKLDCSQLPASVEGEGAFAASDTNIAIVGDHCWVATGGMKSRILYSADKGRNWASFDTPIVQGKPTTGIYSLTFYDEKQGYAIGGDYTDPDNNWSNKIKTTDGGKTWQAVQDGPGYRSCVQYIPDSGGKELVVLGFKGIDYSKDGGITFTRISEEGFYSLRFQNDSVAYAGGNGRLAKLIFR